MASLAPQPRVARAGRLDAVRGLAALAVVFFHLNEPLPRLDNWYRQAASYGWLGVPVFFVLSGFVIHAAALRSGTLGRYARRRLLRIYPPYWASLILVGVVSVCRKLAIGVNDVAVWPKTVGGWAATVAALTSPATNTEGVNWVYWTLGYELAFYAVTALAVVRPRLFLWVAALFCVSAIVPGSAAVPGLFWLNNWPLFAIGVGLSAAAGGDKRGGCLVLLVAAAATARLCKPDVCAVAALTAIAIVSPILERATTELLVRLGLVSYSLYLIHVPIGCYVLLRYKTNTWAADPWRNLLYDLAVAAACVAISALFWWAVERPAQRLAGSLGSRPDRP